MMGFDSATTRRVSDKFLLGLKVLIENRTCSVAWWLESETIHPKTVISENSWFHVSHWYTFPGYNSVYSFRILMFFSYLD